MLVRHRFAVHEYGVSARAAMAMSLRCLAWIGMSASRDSRPAALRKKRHDFGCCACGAVVLGKTRQPCPGSRCPPLVTVFSAVPGRRNQTGCVGKKRRPCSPPQRPLVAVQRHGGGVCPSLSRTNETPNEPPGPYWGLTRRSTPGHSASPLPLGLRGHRLVGRRLWANG